MQNVIFQSLYADPGMSSLKHALFYFGKVRIPKSPFIYVEDESKFIRYVMPVPEHALEHVRHLEQQGYVEFEGEVGDPARLYDMINREGFRAGRTFKYRDVDVMPLYDFLDIPPEDPNPILSQAFNHGVVFLAAQALGSVALGHGLPCVDNPVLFDLMNLGLRGIFQDFVAKHGFSPSEIQDLKAQYLGQHLVKLFLPSFEFRSFDDVLEAREEARDQLFALRARVEQLATEMSSAPWDRDYDAEVTALVKRHVEPQVEELRKAASFSLARVVRRMTTAGVCVILQSMLPDTVAPYLLGASALSLVEAIKQERENVRTARLTHAFSLMLEVRS